MRADGGRKDIVDWVTHGSSGSIIDAYTTMPFETLCTEVAKFRVEVRVGKVLEMFRAVGAENCDTPCDTETADTKKPPSLVGLEAQSFARSRGLEGDQVSTSSPVVEGNRFDLHAVGVGGDQPGKPSVEHGVTTSHSVDAMGTDSSLSAARVAVLRGLEGARAALQQGAPPRDVRKALMIALAAVDDLDA